MLTLLLPMSCLSTNSDITRTSSDLEVDVWAPSVLDTDEESAQTPYTECPAAPGASPMMELTHCIRVSPELSGHEGGGGLAGDTGWGGNEGPLTPPCGFYNLLGGPVLHWRDGHWLGSYCDTDNDGGLWWLEMSPEEERVSKEDIQYNLEELQRIARSGEYEDLTQQKVTKQLRVA